jgi:glycosyltransferase involved in cell wall biosynthesis
MNIILYGHSPLLSTGLGKLMQLACASLVEQKHKIQVLVDEQHELIKEPFPIIPYSPKIKDGFLRSVDQTKPDLLISIGDVWNMLDLYDIISSRPIPWVAYTGVEGLSYPKEAHFGKGKKINTKDLFDLISGIWVFNPKSKDVLRDYHDNIKVLPLAIDYNGIKKAEKYPLREKLKIGDKKIVGYVGDNLYRKGVDRFFDFIRNQKDVIGYVHSPIMNLGNGGFNLDELRSSMGLEERVFLKSDLKVEKLSDDQIYGLYKSFDLFFHPHRAEGFGLCVLEALTAGIPVLSTDTAGPSTFLPSNCKIPTVKTCYIQSGGVGYIGKEPDFSGFLHSKIEKIIKKSSHNYEPIELCYGDFYKNIENLLSVEYKPKLWRRLI